MEEIKIMTEKTGTEISEAMDNDFKYSKDDILQMCNVSERTFRSFLAMQPISQRDFTSTGSSHKQFYNENVLKQFQAWLMKNQINQGVQVRQVKANVENNVKLGLSFQEIVASGNIEAMRELTTFAMNACAEVARNKQLEAEKKALEEQGKQLMLDYQNEKNEHQKDKELVLHKYLTATQIKDTIWKEYGKRIIVSKVIKRIPIEDNDILYKPFTNGNYTGQQPVYHQNVLDKIREIME